MPKVNIIGITGFAGVGKDTLAELFQEVGYRQYSFAAPVKEVCKVAFNLPAIWYSRTYKEKSHPYWNLSPREMAQLVGTELFREKFGEDFWIRRLHLQLMMDYDTQADMKVVISDVRFQNEADWITEMGGSIIKITRPGFDGAVGIAGHASEAGIDTTKYTKGVNYYEILNDRTKLEFTAKSELFIQHYFL